MDNVKTDIDTDIDTATPDDEASSSTNPLTISDRGIAFIKENEGYRSHAYPDPGTGGNPWTIGYGCTGGVTPDMEVDEAEAEQLLREHLLPVEKAINELVIVPITQPQFDALCDFVFNVGIEAFKESHLLLLLNEQQYADVPLQFMRWTKAGGVSLKGLALRRQHEGDLFGMNY